MPLWRSTLLTLPRPSPQPQPFPAWCGRPSAGARPGLGHSHFLLVWGTGGGRVCRDHISDVSPPRSPCELSCPPDHMRTAAVAGISLFQPRGPPAGQMGRLIGTRSWPSAREPWREVSRADLLLKPRHTPHTPSPYVGVSNTRRGSRKRHHEAVRHRPPHPGVGGGVLRSSKTWPLCTDGETEAVQRQRENSVPFSPGLQTALEDFSVKTTPNACLTPSPRIPKSQCP